MEDFTYQDINNLIEGLVIGKLEIQRNNLPEDYKKSQLEKMDQAHKSLRKLRNKLEFKEDPWTWDYDYERRQSLKSKI